MEKSIFKRFDILGSPISFYVEKNKKFKTVFGAFLSFIFITIFLSLFSFYLINYIEKRNPSISYQKQIIDNSENINGNEFFFITGLVGPLSKEIDKIEEKFIFYLRYFYFNSSINNYDFNRTELIPCANSDKYNKLKNKELKSKLYFSDKSYFCVPDDYIFSDIQGSSDNNSTWYVVDLYPCNNSILNSENINNRTCLPYEKLIEEIPHYSLQFIYKDNLVDISNYENPLNSYYKSFFSPGTMQSMTQENLEFSKLIIENNDSFIFSDTNKIKSFSLKNQEKIINPSDGYEYKHKILISILDLHYVYYRSYMKLIDMFAVTYSNLKILMSIFLFLNDRLSSYDIVDYIFSFLFNFYEKEENKD